MKLFSTLCLEITSDCNRRCVFCPVSVNKRPTERMPTEVIYQACKELESIKYRGRVEFYIYNEPVKDKAHLLTALRLFKRRVPGVTTMISTNGDYLRGAEDIEELFNAGLNQMVLNAYSPQQYPRFLSWVNSLTGLSDRNVYKTVSRGARVIKVYDKSKPEEFGRGIFRLQNRAGSIPEYLAPTSEPVSRMCVKPFRLLNINWRGEGLVCCNDYYGDVVIGKFPEQSLVEIWNSPVLNSYRQRLLSKDRSLPLCRVCDCHSGAYPHEVDRSIGDIVSSDIIEKNYATRVEQRNGRLFSLNLRVD